MTAHKKRRDGKLMMMMGIAMAVIGFGVGAAAILVLLRRAIVAAIGRGLGW